MHSTHESFNNKHPPELLVKNFRRVYTSLWRTRMLRSEFEGFFFIKTLLDAFLLYMMEMLPVKTQEIGLMKATGIGKGAVEGVYSSRIE